MLNPRNRHLSHRQCGAAIAIIIVIVVLLGIIIIIIAGSKGGGGNTNTPGGGGPCFTYCMGFVELECGTGKWVGGCIGVWDCSAKNGQHPCL